MERVKFKGLDKLIVQLVKDLENKYRLVESKRKSDFDQALRNFLSQQFKPQVRSYCRSNDLLPDRCYPLERKWNNASFAGFLTYEEESLKIEKLEQKLGLSLFGFFIYLEDRYKKYLDKKVKVPFSVYLFSSLKK